MRKVREVVNTVLSTIAPEQEDKLLDALRYCPRTINRQSDGKEFKEEISRNELSILLGAYNHAESRQTRLQILSMFAKQYSKEELREMIPGLSKWQIDQAHHHAFEEGPGQPVVSTPIQRTRLDPVKTNHFISFIARPNFLQDVAYGTKELKLDSGERITIPNVIRTMVPSRIVKQYLSFCQETVFEPASERTLYRIIDVCAASKQKSLQGLDYFSTEGAQAFETLESVASTLQASGANLTWEKEMKRALKETKRYLKSDFKTHIGPDETCVDHCTSYSLSDTQNNAFSKECNHSHDTSCNLCCELDEVLCNINKMRNSSELTLTDQQQSQVDFDVHQAEEAIQRWKAHLLRTVNQEQAKEETLTKLNTERVLIVMD